MNGQTTGHTNNHSESHRTADELMLYLAGALDRSAEVEVEAHLRTGCPRCSAEIDRAKRVVDELQFALEPIEPPAVAREQLMVAIGRTGRPQPISASAGEVTKATGASEATGTRAGAVSGSIRTIVWRGMAALAAAAAVAVAAVGVTHEVMDQRMQEQARELAEVQLQLAQANEQLMENDVQTARLQRLADLAGELYTTLRSSPLEMVRMEGSAEYENASARLILDRSRNVGHFVGPAGLRLDSGRRLRVWLIGDGQAMSAGTFAPDEFGRARFEIGMPTNDSFGLRAVQISYDDAEQPEHVLLSGNF